MLTTIFIDKLKVHAPIGWFEQERSNKVDLVVSVKVKFEFFAINDHLTNTLDYGTLSQLVIQASQIEMKLLESLAQNILIEIENRAPNGLVSIWVRISNNQIQAQCILAESHGVEVEQHYPKNHVNSVSLQ